MLRTVSTSGRHVGLLVHVPVAASVVRDHGLLTVASAVHGGGQTPYGPATPGDPVDSHPLSGSPGALLHRGPLRSVRATRRGIRLKQARKGVSGVEQCWIFVGAGCPALAV